MQRKGEGSVPSEGAEAADTLHERAVVSHRAGRAAEALPHYRQALELQPQRADIRFHFAVALASTGDTVAALDECIKAIDHCSAGVPPEWWDSARRIADGIGSVNPDASIHPAPGEIAAMLAAGNAWRVIADHGRAEGIYRELASSRQGAAAILASHRLAAMLAMLGRHAEADVLFGRCASAGIAFDHNLRMSRVHLERLDDDADRILSMLPPLQGDFLAQGGEPAILLSGDTRYLRRFATPLLQSLVRNAGFAFAVQVHIIDPDERIVDDLRHNLAALVEGRIAFCTDQGRLHEAVPANVWYACARFLRAPELLRRMQRDLLVLDLDMLALGPVPRPGHDTCVAASVRWHPTRWDPWDTDSASVVWFGADAGGVWAARFVAAVVADSLRAGRGYWFLDQIALFLLRARACTRDGSPRIGDLPVDTITLAGRSAETAPALWSVTASAPYDIAMLARRPYLDYLPGTQRVFGWTLPGYDVFFEQALTAIGPPQAGGRRQWEAELVGACIAEAKSRRRAIDAGAHVGFWSAPLAAAFAHVEAFEPQALVRECFLANVPESNVRLHAAGLYAGGGSANCNIIAPNSGMSYLSMDGAGETPLHALDEWHWDDVDFIKIDVEGLELAVLQGARDTLIRCRPLLLVEHGQQCRRYGVEHGAVMDYLRDLGAFPVRSFPDDNYLFAWRD